MCFIEHCEDVGRWHPILNVMCSSQYVSSATGQVINSAAYFSLHLIYRPKWKNTMRVNAALETQIAAELSLQVSRVHAGRRYLYRMNRADSHVDQRWYQGCNGAARMIEYCCGGVPMQSIEETSLPGSDHLRIQSWGDLRSILERDVVANHDHVDFVGCCSQNPGEFLDLDLQSSIHQCLGKPSVQKQIC